MNKIPEFKTESEERAFWEKNDSSDYLDWKKAEKVVFPGRPSDFTNRSEKSIDRG